MKRVRLVFLLIGICAASAGAAQVSPQNRVDHLVFARQAEAGFPVSPLCSDEVFIRRVYLDVIGTLPRAEEVVRFLDSRDPGKRAKLIDQLLSRPEFADYMALKWCDLLRVKSEFPSNLWPNAVQAYHHWVRDAFRENMPYNQFVYALLTASGSNFRDPPVNYFRPFQERTPRNILNTTALVFMGVRLENSGWSPEQLTGLEAFFGKIAYKKTAEWKEEIVYFDPEMTFLDPQTRKPAVPAFLDGEPAVLGTFDDPRAAFADWLTSPDNPWFAKNIVNRIWYWLMGRGIIDEVDDIRPDNPPWNPELLAYLEQELVEHQYSFKRIYRLVLNSATYQLSSVPTDENIDDEAGFSHYRIRRLDAEVLIDAISQITGIGEDYSSAIPEPFTYIPRSQRTIMLADGSIKSSFLEMFGRPGRDTSLESDRNNGVSVFQTLHLLNSSHIQDKIMNGWKLKKLIQNPPKGLLPPEALYLEILSRYPGDEEKETVQTYLSTSGLPRDQALQDVAWALINSSEFILKH
ncbi:MAG: DUF1553 domain-containing protein [Kiritimatiellales bacterium]